MSDKKLDQPSLASFATDFIEQSADMYCLANNEGYFVDCSPSWSKALGWSRAELLAKPFFELIHPDDLDKTIKAAEAAFAGNEIAEFSNRYRCKSGHYLHLRWNSWHHQASGLTLAIASDITPLRTQTEVLREVETISRTGTWWVDVKQSTAHWSPMTYEIHEVPLGTPIRVEDGINYYVEEHRPIIQACVEEGIRTNKPWDVELKIRTTIGKEVWVRAIGSALVKDGEVLVLQGTFQDINDRKERELEVQRHLKELASYETALNSSAIIARTDAKGVITMVNDNFCAISGFGRDELIGKTHAIVNSGYHPESFFAQMWKTIASGQTWRGEICNRTKDGSIYWVDSSITPMLNPEGQIKEYLAIRYDVTARKTAEQELARQRDMMDSITRVQANFISSGSDDKPFDQLLQEVLDVTGSEYGFIGEVLYKNGLPYLKTHAITNISWNKETRNFYDANAPVGLEFYNLKSLFGHVLTNREVVIANDPANDERRGGLPPGHPPLNAFLGIPLIYNDRLVGSIGIANREAGYDQAVVDEVRTFVDSCSILIHSLKEARELEEARNQLRENEEFQRLAIEGSGDGVWDWNIVTGLFNFSDNWARMLGYDPQSLNNSFDTWMNIVHPDDLAELNSALQNHLLGKTLNFNAEYRVVCHDGQYRWLSSRAKVVDRTREGNPRRMVGANSDITKMKEIEQQLEQAKQTAERASRAKDRFLANMSHEIRTPMNAVIGMTDLLMDSKLSRDQHENVETLKASGENLLAIINDILDFSKIEAGMLQMDPQEFDLPELLDQVVKSFAVLAVKSKLVIQQEFSQLPQRVIADDVRLRQILSNLLSNALKFTKEGSITIRANCSVEGSNRLALTFEVADTGIGMTEEQMARLFQPFTQGDSSTSRKFGGTGLGLTICRSLAELMGGAINVTSKPNEGTCMRVTVQAELAADQSAAKPAPAQTQNDEQLADQVPMRILIAEDNIVNQRLAVKLLGRLGYMAEQDVYVANNGQEAIDQVSQRTFDLVLMDVQMPEVDGIEATQQIRNAGGQQPHIVALTANVFAEDRARCLAAGMDGFLGKPIVKADLRDVILSIANNTERKSS